MTLSLGLHLGSYEILELLGKGGMGEVYRARDTKLLREVAIKALPEAFAEDPERLARFQREARLLASLNHPNIATVHGLEQANSVRFLVLELVPGLTLAEKLKAGPVPMREALQIFHQITEGLGSAHEKGIVHRDLKPANIKVTPEGKVKILDFGLAKAFESSSSSVADFTDSPTESLIATENGMILGTAPYMSPEQVRGRMVGRSSDIWAFGCVCYETLTGKRAFQGDTASDTVAKILAAEPDWSKLLDTPVSIQRLLRRCLQKELNHRLQDIGDARIEIEEILAAPQESIETELTSAKPKPTSAWKRTAQWAAVGLLAMIALLAMWFTQSKIRQSSDRQTVRFIRLTDFPGLEEFPAISPDGKSVAFTADVSGKQQIWIRLLVGGPPLQITHDAADHLFPRWSQDSASLIYYSPSETETHGTIWEVSALGGSPRLITKSIGGVDLSHDGKKIAFFRFQSGRVELALVSRNGSNPELIARLDPAFNYFYPRWSPDDEWISYQRGIVFDYDIFVVPAKGGEPRSLFSDGSLLSGFSWLPNGNGIVYSSSRGSTILYLPPFNLWTVDLKGKAPRQLTFGETSYFYPDLNKTGSLVASRMSMQFDIWRYPVDSTPVENVSRAVRITRQTGQVQTPSISPDDRELVYLSDSGGHGNLWVLKLDSGETRQITHEQDPGISIGVPVWSPNGKNIAFVLRKPGGWTVDLWLVSPDGSNLRRVSERSGWAAWSSDGRWLYYSVSTQGIWELKKVSMERDQPVTIRPENLQAPAVAPDGSALYFTRYLANVNGAADQEIRVARPENGPSQILARIPGSRIPAWQLVNPVISSDGKWLAMPLSDEGVTNIWAMPTAGGAPLWQITDFGQRRTFIARRVSWSSDGKFIFAAIGEGDADVLLLNGLIQQ